MTIGITGATGHLGRLVVQGLKARVPADGLVALVRSAAKAADLGIPAREADYDKPETLGPALAGIDTLLLISGNEVGQRARQHQAVIEAAKEAGVKWIVYTSILRADTSTIGLAQEHLATERAIEASGIPFTFLRNGWYTENYESAVPAAVANGVVLGSSGEGRVSSASRADYAEAAIAVLTSGGHEGKVYELAGDTGWTKADLAAEISRQSGKPVVYNDLPEAEYATVLEGFGLPAPFPQALAGWDTATAQGALHDDSRQLSTLIGRPTTPLADTVRDTLAQSA